MKYILDCISDTHMQHASLVFPVPENYVAGEDVWILVHAGDFSHHGKWNEVKDFTFWLQDQPHDHKVVICGNHELLMDQDRWDTDTGFREEALRKGLEFVPPSVVHGPNIHMLEDSDVIIQGLKFWGSPYSPRFFDWGFQTDSHNAEVRWSKIPQDTDVLIVHGPPKWAGDACPDINDRDKTVYVGCPALLKRLIEVNPLLSVHGHIHEGFGVYQNSNARTTILNASVLNGRYMLHGSQFRVTIQDSKVTTDLL